jgi:hypothetical protein
MVTRTTITRFWERIEAAVSRLNPEPPKPQHPGIDWLRRNAIRFGATEEEAEARIAAAARLGHEHLRNHPAHPLYGRSATAEEERAVYESARAQSHELLRRWAEKKWGWPFTE